MILLENEFQRVLNDLDEITEDLEEEIVKGLVISEHTPIIGVTQDYYYDNLDIPVTYVQEGGDIISDRNPMDSPISYTKDVTLSGTLDEWTFSHTITLEDLKGYLEETDTAYIQSDLDDPENADLLLDDMEEYIMDKYYDEAYEEAEEYVDSDDFDPEMASLEEVDEDDYDYDDADYDEDAYEDDMLEESVTQELGDIYSALDKKYNLNLDELIHGKDGFMETKYPDGFEDFKGDIVYSQKYWKEFEQWLKDTKGIDLADGKGALTESVGGAYCDRCDTTPDYADYEAFSDTAYGEHLCDDCWDEYINSRDALVEYVIGIANADYDVTDFDDSVLVDMAACWHENKKNLALSAAEIAQVEADAAANGFNFTVTDPDGNVIYEKYNGKKNRLKEDTSINGILSTSANPTLAKQIFSEQSTLGAEHALALAKFIAKFTETLGKGRQAALNFQKANFKDGPRDMLYYIKYKTTKGVSDNTLIFSMNGKSGLGGLYSFDEDSIEDIKEIGIIGLEGYGEYLDTCKPVTLTQGAVSKMKAKRLISSKALITASCEDDRKFNYEFEDIMRSYLENQDSWCINVYYDPSINEIASDNALCMFYWSDRLRKINIDDNYDNSFYEDLLKKIDAEHFEDGRLSYSDDVFNNPTY